MFSPAAPALKSRGTTLTLAAAGGLGIHSIRVAVEKLRGTSLDRRRVLAARYADASAASGTNLLPPEGGNKLVGGDGLEPPTLSV